MRPDDSGLTIFQQRLFECAKIIREGKFEHSRGFSMRAYNTCALGEYHRAHPEASTVGPEVIFCPPGQGTKDFDEQMIEHFLGIERNAPGYWPKYGLIAPLFSHTADSNRESVAQRIENYVFAQLCKS